jgi:C1A family cysteine protease
MSTYFGITPSTLPLTVDLRPKCSPVSDQGDLDSCVAFAIIGAIEYLENLQSETFVSLSPQFVFYNERVLEGTVDQNAGTYMEDGLRVVSTYGACELSLWPYNKENLYAKPNDAAYADALKRKALSYSSVAQDQTSVMKTLHSGFPIVFGFLVYSGFESLEVEKTGMVQIPTPSETLLGGHAMLIVGYDLPGQRFLVRNSWGTHWGVEGYCWMPFAYLLSPNLANSFYSIESIS